MAEKLWLLVPLFLLANLHCLGMCGPIALMLGKSRWRLFYLVGRATGFALAGLFCAGFGMVVSVQSFHLSALLSLLIGLILIASALVPLFGKLAFLLEPLNKKMTLLLLKDQWWPTLLFGLSTVFLPCGQSLLVYSLAALTGDPLEGMATTLLFALLTTPSLLFAFEMRRLLQRFYSHCNRLLTTLTLLIGALSCLRSFADFGAIPHYVLLEGSATHIVLW